MITCKALDKGFESKEELFKELRSHKSEIISIKKAQIHKSYEKDSSITIKARSLDLSKVSEANKAIDFDDNYYYLAVNSTRILDSHDDVHLDNIWNKSVKDLQGKNYLVDTHVMSVNTTIVRKEHIEMLTAMIPFSMIGKSYKGDTQVLIYKFPKDKVIDAKAKEWLDSGDDIEASVKMRYTDIVLAMNSEHPDDKEELKEYKKYIDSIANKDDFENEIYFFWAVKQAQNMHESSLVLFGSNSSTGVMESSTKIEQSDDTQAQEEAAKALQEINYKFLVNSLKGIK